jgi:uncharacterized protein
MAEPVPERIQVKIDKVTSLIRGFSGAVVALSAGVDSSLVALIAHRALGDSSVAVTGESESLPPEELEVAKETAKAIGIRHMIVRTNELQNPDYYSNPENRCYFCKETLYGELRALSDKLGFVAILDGTHIDDLADDRPGLRAAQDAGVVSPLLLASFSKADVREAARVLGLSVWDKPAMPCLSSRIAHGEEITIEKLGMIGEAELYIRRLTGVRNLRVRLSDGMGRIEVSPEEGPEQAIEIARRAGLPLVVAAKVDKVDRELRRLGFVRVTLDLRGYTKREATPSETLTLPMASVP